jgi:hypothetical protein
MRHICFFFGLTTLAAVLGSGPPATAAQTASPPAAVLPVRDGGHFGGSFRGGYGWRGGGWHDGYAWRRGWDYYPWRYGYGYYPYACPYPYAYTHVYPRCG